MSLWQVNPLKISYFGPNNERLVYWEDSSTAFCTTEQKTDSLVAGVFLRMAGISFCVQTFKAIYLASSFIHLLFYAKSDKSQKSLHVHHPITVQNTYCKEGRNLFSRIFSMPWLVNMYKLRISGENELEISNLIVEVVELSRYCFLNIFFFVITSYLSALNSLWE